MKTLGNKKTFVFAFAMILALGVGSAFAGGSFIQQPTYQYHTDLFVDGQWSQSVNASPFGPTRFDYMLKLSDEIFVPNLPIDPPEVVENISLEGTVSNTGTEEVLMVVLVGTNEGIKENARKRIIAIGTLYPGAIKDLDSFLLPLWDEKVAEGLIQAFDHEVKMHILFFSNAPISGKMSQFSLDAFLIMNTIY